MLSKREIQYIEKGRYKARTDLVWLCHNILGMKKIAPHVHGPMVEFLQGFQDHQGTDVVKEDGKYLYTPIDSDPVKVLPSQKRRLILAPRGWYKTSLNIIAHTIQWILNYPDVTILIVHASQEVAENMLVFIKEQFRKNTTMRYFFPEFCPAPRVKEWGTRQYFNTEARKNWTTAPTVSVGGIESVRTGMHYHILKFTDIVDEKNTATKDQCEKVIFSYGMYRNLLISPEYWIDMEGTRYNFSDLYGRQIDEWIKQPEDKKQYKIFVMGCYKKDLGERKETFAPDELDAPYLFDVEGRRISRFPEEFSYEKLEDIRTDPVTGEDMFNTQQLNNPIDTENMVFPIKDLRWKSEEDLKKVPMQYYQTTVDLAETTGKRSDFTVITTCGVDRMNRRYIVDIQMGKFLPDAIVSRLFVAIAKWKPIKVKIEETGFVRGLMPAIRRMSEVTNMWPNFEFLKRDNQVAKEERIMSIQPWYKGGLLFFSEGLDPHVKEQLKHQLTRFPKYQHDDILDTLADQFQNELVFGPLKESPTMKESLQRARDVMLNRAELYESVFGKQEPNDSWIGLGAL